MINWLRVSNYRSLGENVRVELGRFTVLVGPNGSGKSNVVDALGFVSDALRNGLSGAITDRDGIGAVIRWTQGGTTELSFEVGLSLDAGPASYGFALLANAEDYEVHREEGLVHTGGQDLRFRIESRHWVEQPHGLAPFLEPRSLVLTIMSGDSRFQPLAQTLQQIAIYSVIPDALRGPQRYSPIKPMDRFGSTWASILRDQPAETWKPDLIDALHRLTGDIEDIKITTVESHLIVRFRHTAAEGQAKWLFTTQESDGTLRVAGILTALLQEPPLPVLAIEEPELTVHPGALPLLYDFLQQASRRCQVIVTTHSPELLDLIAADDIRVVHRTEEGTRVDRMAEDQRQAVRDGLLTLGDVLRTEGLRSESPATSRERLG